jgi:hypothetical protein
MCNGVFEMLSSFQGFVSLREKGKYVEDAWG